MVRKYTVQRCWLVNTLGKVVFVYQCIRKYECTKLTLTLLKISCR